MDSSFRRRVELPDGMEAQRRHQAPTERRSFVRDARRPRHAALLDAVQRIDAEISPAARDELARWVRDEYQSEFADIPLGFVAQCHLGPPYVDHVLDLLHTIVEHYAPADPMPEPFASARMLVRSGAYAYVEIYGSGAIRPVLPDGTVVA